jgi:hypothetical protein
VELTISAGGDEQALEQFYHWLRQDVDVVRSAEISTAGSSGSGHMGAFEVVSMSISSLVGLANLSIAWASFRRSRTDAPPLTITLAGPWTDEQLAVLVKQGLPLAPGVASGGE